LQVVPTVDKGSIGGYPPKIFLQPGYNPSMKKVKGKKFGIFEPILFHKALVIDWNPVSKQ